MLNFVYSNATIDSDSILTFLCVVLLQLVMKFTKSFHLSMMQRKILQHTMFKLTFNVHAVVLLEHARDERLPTPNSPSPTKAGNIHRGGFKVNNKENMTFTLV